jgi:hypothetical protein
VLRDRFRAGYSVGLFIDQREPPVHPRPGAEKVAELLRLHLFIFRGGGNGGPQTVSIDLPKSLARGRKILRSTRSHCRPPVHGGRRDDGVAAAGAGREFDAIMLDPPTFSRSHRGKAFQVENDFETCFWQRWRWRNAMQCSAPQVLHPGERALEVMGRFCLKATRRAASFIANRRCPIFRREWEQRPSGFPPIGRFHGVILSGVEDL